ncbi:ThiF family adenylyltransferase, partial [uncultured Campylobacter sp.]|uniref:HesA/MoeB/ThiF family protein n=1 Tax=uncultured Campylobacter sp. TaxID=218934 RepID=UPI00262E70C9
MNYFHRQIQLWGEQTQRALADKRILIIGAGGLGSSLSYALGASGIGRISVVDFDTVALHNIHRQILFTLEDEGKFKADVFKSRTESRYDGVSVEVHKSRAEEFFASAIDSGEKFDLILDATDNLATRAQIDAFAKQIGVPWVFASVDSWQCQVCFVQNADFKFFPSLNATPAGITAA